MRKSSTSPVDIMKERDSEGQDLSAKRKINHFSFNAKVKIDPLILFLHTTLRSIAKTNEYSIQRSFITKSLDKYFINFE